jgi:hypothetical protein
MPSKLNCWEIMKCGRQIGGDKAGTEGPCPSMTTVELASVNSGDFGGRICWKVKDDFNGTRIPNWSNPNKNCLECKVLRMVNDEEGDSFVL